MKITKFFKPSILEDFYDYKKSTHLIFFTIHIIIVILMLLSSNHIIVFTGIPLMLMVLIYLYRKVLIHDIKVFGKHWEKYVVFVLLGFIFVTVLNASGALITTGLVGSAPNQDAVISAFWQTPILGAFYIAIAGPISEELIFRRAIKGMSKNKLLYYFLSVSLFAFMHIIVDFSFPQSFAPIFGYALPALGFAFLYDKSNNIWCPIFVHILINTLAVIGILLA